MPPAFSPARLRGLDTLRAFAVVLVVMYHLTIFGELPEGLQPAARFGWMGVDLFFALSGFLIGQQVLKPYRSGGRLRVGEFYRRRAYRVLPAYLLVLALYVGVPGWRESPGLAPVWKFLTFTMNFGIQWDHRAFSNAWSLCVEEHFYLLLPLAVLLLRRRPSTWVTAGVFVVLVAGGIGLRALLMARFPDETYAQIYYPSYTRLDGLLAGLSLAVMRVFRPGWWARLMQHGQALLVGGLGCVGCVMGMFWQEDIGSSEGWARQGMIWGLPLLALGWGLITASSVSERGWLARGRVPGAKWMATMAFTLYLTHKPVAHWVKVAWPGTTAAKGPVSWAMYAVACLGVAWVLHVGVERPFLSLRDRERGVRRLEAEALREPAL